MQQPSGKTSPFAIYILITGTSSALMRMMFVVSSLYFVSTAHLDPLQLVLLGTALEAAIFIFEIPTGVVADVYSRKASIIIGFLIIGIGLLIEAAWATFWPLFLSQVIWGIGYTFTSGATQAWISDEIGEEAANAAFLRGAQADKIGALLGIIAGAWLGTLTLQTPIWISGMAFFFIATLLFFVMPEKGFHAPQRLQMNRFQELLDTFRKGVQIVRQRPQLTEILGIGFFFGLYSEGLDRLWVAHLLEKFQFPFFQPVVWMGIIEAVGMVLTIVVIQIVQKRIQINHIPSLIKTQSIATILLLAALAGFIFSPWLALSIPLILLITALRELNYPLYTAWVNQKLDPQIRATVLSMSSQMDAMGQITGGPIIGLIAQKLSITIGLTGSLLMLSPVMALFKRQRKANQETTEL